MNPDFKNSELPKFDLHDALDKLAGKLENTNPEVFSAHQGRKYLKIKDNWDLELLDSKKSKDTNTGKSQRIASNLTHLSGVFNAIVNDEEIDLSKKTKTVEIYKILTAKHLKPLKTFIGRLLFKIFASQEEKDLVKLIQTSRNHFDAQLVKDAESSWKKEVKTYIPFGNSKTDSRSKVEPQPDSPITTNDSQSPGTEEIKLEDDDSTISSSSVKDSDMKIEIASIDSDSEISKKKAIENKNKSTKDNPINALKEGPRTPTISPATTEEDDEASIVISDLTDNRNFGYYHRLMTNDVGFSDNESEDDSNSVDLVSINQMIDTLEGADESSEEDSIDPKKKDAAKELLPVLKKYQKKLGKRQVLIKENSRKIEFVTDLTQNHEVEKALFKYQNTINQLAKEAFKAGQIEARKKVEEKLTGTIKKNGKIPEKTYFNEFNSHLEAVWLNGSPKALERMEKFLKKHYGVEGNAKLPANIQSAFDDYKENIIKIVNEKQIEHIKQLKDEERIDDNFTTPLFLKDFDMKIEIVDSDKPRIQTMTINKMIDSLEHQENPRNPIEAKVNDAGKMLLSVLKQNQEKYGDGTILLKEEDGKVEIDSGFESSDEIGQALYQFQNTLNQLAEEAKAFPDSIA